MSLKILVTGGTGFVGHYIVKRLTQAGFQVTVLVRQENHKTKELQALDSTLKLAQGDLTDYDLLESICQDQDIIVHAAAMVSFDYSLKKTIFETNVTGTSHLINAALACNVKKFIFISSIATMSHAIDDPVYAEKFPWNPKADHSIYAFSKHAAEMEVWRGGAEGLQIGILNPSVVLGRWDTTHHSMQIFEQVKKNVSFYPPGSTGWVDVRDVAESVVSYIARDLDRTRIIINGHNASYLEVMNKSAQVLGLRPPRYQIPRTLAGIGGSLISLLSGWFGKKHILNSAIIKSLFSQRSFDNANSVELLGMAYRRLDETILWALGKDDEGGRFDNIG